MDRRTDEGRRCPPHAPRRPVPRIVAFAVITVILGVLGPASGCAGRSSGTGGSPAGTAEGTAASTTPDPGSAITLDESVFLDTLAVRTFRFFADHTNPANGLSPDRWPTESFVSVAACGFALNAWPIAVERGWMTREDAAGRALRTLAFFLHAPQGEDSAGTIGYRGFFYHFLEPASGHRFRDVELSTVDTALFLAGALFCQSYFDAHNPVEAEVRALADSLYLRTEWDWASPRAPLIGHGWDPAEGHLPYDWGGYSEAMILYILALGSPTHPADPGAWEAWTRGYRWGSWYGQEHLGFAPLFGHQYSHVWIDFRGIQDAWMAPRGIDYFENSRRATLAQRAYALENPQGWSGYGERLWGLTACDGPVHGQFTVGGALRQFETYSARGSSFTEVRDDGTIAPTAMAASLPFAPEVVVPGLRAMVEDHPEVWTDYGFLDSLNPTFTFEVPVQHGRVVPGVGWVDGDYLGIDQGPILAMIENHRSELIWKTMRKNPHVVRGLRAAGFRGGWLDSQGDAGPGTMRGVGQDEASRGAAPGGGPGHARTSDPVATSAGASG